MFNGSTSIIKSSNFTSNKANYGGVLVAQREGTITLAIAYLAAILLMLMEELSMHTHTVRSTSVTAPSATT